MKKLFTLFVASLLIFTSAGITNIHAEDSAVSNKKCVSALLDSLEASASKNGISLNEELKKRKLVHSGTYNFSSDTQTQNLAKLLNQELKNRGEQTYATSSHSQNLMLLKVRTTQAKTKAKTKKKKKKRENGYISTLLIHSVFIETM